MNIIRKDATITNTDDATDPGPGSFEVILSAPTLDRDGDTLKPEEWKQPLPDHITFDVDHGMSVASTVGSGVPRIDEKGNLVVAGTYSSLPRAQEVRTLVNEGHVRTTSVAFMNTKTTKDGKTVNARELLNGAFVSVPSNREALILASKGLKAGARNSAADATMIQTIHDTAASLGAACGSAKHLDDGRITKSVEGSLEATQDRVRDALNDAYGADTYVWLRATLPADGGGTCIFEVDAAEGSDCETYQQSYTDDGSTVTLTGDRAAVDLAEVVRPDPDEEPADAAASEEPAAAKAAAGTDDAAEKVALQTRATAASLAALTRIATA